MSIGPFINVPGHVVPAPPNEPASEEDDVPPAPLADQAASEHGQDD